MAATCFCDCNAGSLKEITKYLYFNISNIKKNSITNIEALRVNLFSQLWHLNMRHFLMDLCFHMRFSVDLKRYFQESFFSQVGHTNTLVESVLCFSIIPFFLLATRNSSKNKCGC